MKLSRFTRLSLLAAICLACAGSALAQDRGEGPLDPAPPKGVTAQEIIQKFAAREKEFEIARDNYTYRQSVKVQTLDGDTPDGEYQEVVDVLFDDKGRRVEQVILVTDENENQPAAKSHMLVLARITAPASISLRTRNASLAGRYSA